MFKMVVLIAFVLLSAFIGIDAAPTKDLIREKNFNLLKLQGSDRIKVNVTMKRLLESKDLVFTFYSANKDNTGPDTTKRSYSVAIPADTFDEMDDNNFVSVEILFTGTDTVNATPDLTGDPQSINNFKLNEVKYLSVKGYFDKVNSLEFLFNSN